MKFKRDEIWQDVNRDRVRILAVDGPYPNQPIIGLVTVPPIHLLRWYTVDDPGLVRNVTLELVGQ